jgi:hypothetical protein
MKSLAAHLALWPPSLVRFLARSGRGRGARRLTNAEIAAASGLSHWQVARLATLDDWTTVRVGDADRFIAACGFDPAKAWMQRRYLKRVLLGNGRFAYAQRNLGVAPMPRHLPTPKTLVAAAMGSVL